MLIQNKQIAIIGGGPGGLTLARLLQMKGTEVKVYERDIDEHTRVQGATLDLHEESGLEAIREAGLIHEFHANYRPGAEKIRIMDELGQIIVDEHGGNSLGNRAESRPEIDSPTSRCSETRHISCLLMPAKASTWRCWMRWS